jgi:hypothetical protein
MKGVFRVSRVGRRRSQLYHGRLSTCSCAEGGQGRAMLADALFDRIEVLGVREASMAVRSPA